ncbi:MAG TPA: hypothetical protein PL112_22880, partial [Candidatus Obscuribacter sp.]|nr:hypothetical protein [Candidatus Obscuribacter sp.]
PANSIVVGVPGRVIYRDGKKVEKKEGDVPDIEAEAIKSLRDHINKLEAELLSLRSKIKGQQNAIEDLKSQLPASLNPPAADASGTDYQALPGGESDKTDPVDVFLQGAGI